MSVWLMETCSPDQTRHLGVLLGRVLEAGAVVFLEGGLGAGKTCFAQGVARGLDVPEALPVTSPTFVIMNQYPGRLALHHFDLYRLAGPEDLETVGLEEVAGGSGVSLVEWPSQAGLEIPALVVRLTVTGESSRRLEAEASDPDHRRMLRSWQEAWTHAS